MRISDCSSDVCSSVLVSIVCFSRGVVGPSAGLNGLPVPRINADLTGGAKTVDLTQAASLASNKNLAFQGVKFGGPFEITGDDARRLLMSRGNPNGASNSEVVCRWITGLDLTRRTEERWCINFDGISSAAEAALFEAPYELFDQQWAAENARRAAENPPLPQLRANEAASLAKECVSPCRSRWPP